MNWDELKDRLKSEWQQTLDRLQESSLYIKLHDRYEDLSPVAQKGVIIGGLFVLLLVFLSVPWSPFDESYDNLSQFSDKRALMRDLLHVQKEINETPDIPLPPPPESVRSRVQSQLQNAQLLPEQIKSVTVMPPVQNKFVSQAQNDGLVEISLAQLNLKQIVDLGADFQSINPSVKMKDLIVQANSQDPRYFDVIYRLMVLKVAQETAAPAEEPPGPGGKKSIAPKPKGKGR